MYTHIHTHTYIWYVLIALSRGSDPLHVRRFRADHPRSKSWWYRGWNVTWILGINRASTRAPQIINSSAASLSNAIPPLPSLTGLFNFRNRWICEEGTIAPRIRTPRTAHFNTLAEETLREGRGMLNRNRFFPFSYLRNWWVESILLGKLCISFFFFIIFFFFKEILCFFFFLQRIRELNLVVLVSVKIKLKVKEIEERWDIIRDDRLFRIGSFFFLK